MKAARSVLLANEPLSYREALVHVVGALCPTLDVRAVEAATLEREVRRLAPLLVICSHLDPAIEDCAHNWVELYPGHGGASRVCVYGKRRTVEDMHLADVLAIIDEAHGAARS